MPALRAGCRRGRRRTQFLPRKVLDAEGAGDAEAGVVGEVG